MTKSTKLFAPSKGCEFCSDPDFALRHALEDQVLNKIAAMAIEIAQQPGIVLTKEQKDRLWGLVQDFKNLDTLEDQQRRAVKALQAIEDDLS